MLISKIKLKIGAPFLILLVSFLISTLVFSYLMNDDPRKEASREFAPTEKRSLEVVEEQSGGASLQHAGAFLTKPLFLAERDATLKPSKPVVKLQKEEQQQPVPQMSLLEPLELKVVGTINDDGEYIGLFLPAAGGDMVRLAVGDSYKKWRLVKFEADSVLFVSGKKSEILHIAE
ncbi:hypothetical protein [Thalassospira sp.]|uniref:hypothetical protein n=1 Tax=Thalassospira sp. TaxID=1912094 RepID=UPI0032EAEB25